MGSLRIAGFEEALWSALMTTLTSWSATESPSTPSPTQELACHREICFSSRFFFATFLFLFLFCTFLLLSRLDAHTQHAQPKK
jgi:hypothetical protein